MERTPDYVSRGLEPMVQSEDDREAAIDLLYEEIEKRCVREEPFRGIIEVIKYARVEFGLSIIDAKLLVDDLRYGRHRQGLWDMGMIL